MASKIKVRIRDTNNIHQLKKVFEALNEYQVEVGIFGENDSGEEPSYVMIASVHEFGATVRRGKSTIVIPERSFMRTTFDSKKNEWTAFIKRQLKLVYTFQIDPKMLYERLGARMVADIQEAITDLNSPPNAQSTIAKKGSSNPLIDTGGMRSRVTYRVVEK